MPFTENHNKNAVRFYTYQRQYCIMSYISHFLLSLSLDLLSPAFLAA